MGGTAKRVGTAALTGGLSEGVRLLRTGASSRARDAAAAQARAQAQQEEQIAKQQQREDSRLAESEGDIARRRALTTGKRAGRSLLIATGPSGVQGVRNLGGG